MSGLGLIGAALDAAFSNNPDVMESLKNIGGKLAGAGVAGTGETLVAGIAHEGGPNVPNLLAGDIVQHL